MRLLLCMGVLLASCEIVPHIPIVDTDTKNRAFIPDTFTIQVKKISPDDVPRICGHRKSVGCVYGVGTSNVRIYWSFHWTVLLHEFEHIIFGDGHF